MAVIEPLKVTIENFPSTSAIEIQVPNFPNDESKGSHKVTFDKVVYIDSVDFQEVINVRENHSSSIKTSNLNLI